MDGEGPVEIAGISGRDEQSLLLRLEQGHLLAVTAVDPRRGGLWPSADRPVQ
jgi:hypothetical protein